MTSKEEKEAIETMQTIIEFGGDNFLCKEHRKQLQIILNLINKQQKEIEEWINGERVSIHCVHKDKIKATIEELQEHIKYSANPLSIDYSKFGVKLLQSLLEGSEDNEK